MVKHWFKYEVYFLDSSTQSTQVSWRFWSVW